MLAKLSLTLIIVVMAFMASAWEMMTQSELALARASINDADYHAPTCWDRIGAIWPAGMVGGFGLLIVWSA